MQRSPSPPRSPPRSAPRSPPRSRARSPARRPNPELQRWRKLEQDIDRGIARAKRSPRARSRSPARPANRPRDYAQYLASMSEMERERHLLSLPGYILWDVCEKPENYIYCNEYLWKAKLKEGGYPLVRGKTYREQYENILGGFNRYRWGSSSY